MHTVYSSSHNSRRGVPDRLPAGQRRNPRSAVYSLRPLPPPRRVLCAAGAAAAGAADRHGGHHLDGHGLLHGALGWKGRRKQRVVGRRTPVQGAPEASPRCPPARQPAAGQGPSHTPSTCPPPPPPPAGGLCGVGARARFLGGHVHSGAVRPLALHAAGHLLQDHHDRGLAAGGPSCGFSGTGVNVQHCCRAAAGLLQGAAPRRQLCTAALRLQRSHPDTPTPCRAASLTHPAIPCGAAEPVHPALHHCKRLHCGHAKPGRRLGRSL